MPLVSFVPAGDGRLDVPEAGDRAEVADSIAAAAGRPTSGCSRPATGLSPARSRSCSRGSRSATRTCCSSGTTRPARSCWSASPPSPARWRRTRASPTPRAAPWDNVVRRTLLDAGRGAAGLARDLARAARRRSGSTRCPRPLRARGAGDAARGRRALAAHEAVLADPGRAARAPQADRARGRPPPARAARARRAGASTTRSSTASPRSSTPTAAAASAAAWRRCARACSPATARAPTAPSGAPTGRQRAARRRARRMRTARREAPAHRAPPPRLPGRAEAPDRRAPRRLRRLLVPRLLLQPARDLREGARARARRSAASGSSSPSTPRTSRRASSVVAPGTPEYFDVMARAQVLRQQRQLPERPTSSAPGSVHVMTHHGTPLKYMGMDLRANRRHRGQDGLRRAAAPLRALGLQRLLEPALAPRSGRRSTPSPYETLEVGYPRNDVLATATGEAVAAARAGARPRARAARRALRADPPRLGDRLRAGARPRRGRGGARPGRRPARPRALLLRCRPVARALRPRGPAARRRRASLGRGPCAWRPTCW